MSEKEEPRTRASCPNCNEPIPENAPGGICPKCALAEAAASTSDPTAPMTGARFNPPSPESLAKSFPQLEILELIGCGGMGAVYLARQENLDRRVALKILSPALAESPSFTERFSREGRLLARLNHPNIVGVHDFGESDGFFFLIMEHVDGVNLRQAMRAGRFTPEQAIGVVPKICEALQYAHEEGVLHRDIKPENILLDERGRVKIADFGIAKLVDENAPDAFSLTGTSMPGTPQYMAPEQIENPSMVDHRADIFSLGVVFYEMLTGELPMGRFAAPSEKTAVDSQIDEIVFRALEKERDRRQQSAEEVKTELEGVSVADLAKMRHPGYASPDAGAFVMKASGGKKAALFVLVGLALILLLQTLANLAVKSNALNEARLKQQQQIAVVEAEAELGKLTAEIEQLETRLSENPPDANRVNELGRLKARRGSLEEGARLLREKHQVVRAKVITRKRLSLTMYLGVALLLLVVGIPGTLMGWRSLQRIRVFDLSDGRTSALFAALFWPLVLLTIVVFCLIALPMSGGPGWIGGLGLSLSIVASGILVWLIVKKTKSWLASPSSEDERAAAIAIASRQPVSWEKWTFALLAFLLVGPAIALLSSLLGLSHGFVEIVIVVALCGLIGFMIYRFRNSGHSRANPTSRASGADNPWPKWIFWLVFCIVFVPIFLILVGLMLPYFALERTGPPPPPPPTEMKQGANE